MNLAKNLCLVLLAYFAIASSLRADPPIPTNYPVCAITKIQNEEQIFVCPTDSNIVLADWRDFRLGYRQVGIGRSTDAGNTWTHSLIPSSLVLYDRQSDPTMAVDNAGNYYVCVLDYNSGLVDGGDESYITFIKSTDQGATWTGPYPVEDGFYGYFEDKQFIAVDRTNGPYEGNVYVAWARFPNPNKIMFSRSTDGGLTFDDPQIVGAPMDFPDCGITETDAGQFAFPLVGSDGTVYVFWRAGYYEPPCYNGLHAQMMVKSTDGGVTFSEPVIVRFTKDYQGIVDGDVETYDNPACAADISGGPFDGNIYMANANVDMTNTTPIFPDWNIEFIRSTDNGATWSSPIYINDDYIGDGALFDQFHPWLTCNDEGTLVIIWYDQRTDPVYHYKFDLFAAYSFDGGESFTTNHRISDASISPQYLGYLASTREDQMHELIPKGIDYEQTRAGKIAEYIGVTAYKNHVNAVWTDTRYQIQQDVFGANWVIPMFDPKAVSPIGSAKTLEYPYLKWTGIWNYDDVQYLVEVYHNGDLIISQTVTDAHYTPTEALPDGYYTWKVKGSKISTAEETAYSATALFRVDTYIPPVPTLISPTNTELIFEAHPTFTWDLGVPPASDVYYDLTVSPDETFTNPDLIRQYTDIESNSYQLPDVVYTDSIYFWKVSAKNWAGQSQGETATFSFEYFNFICGELDGEDGLNVLDVVFLINFQYKNGAAPRLLEAADVNNDGDINILDIVRMINFLYKDGQALVCPQP